MNYDILKKRSATSLIEVVIAIFILAVAFLPIMRVVDYGSTSTSKIGHYAKATRLAQDLIEECKHVPFKVYQTTYGELEEGKDFIINEEFYKDTKKSIDDFREESKDKLKEFDCKANLRVKKNDLGQISEVWFEVEIGWYDLGKISNGKGEKRKVKVGNAYFNSEVL
ncbi:MAG: hypothetical protein J6Z11_15005 [Candidatus Riflebacteria bacterium]|nr:hypothetical protein [Candidatus Riflebacteria bacterium]